MRNPQVKRLTSVDLKTTKNKRDSNLFTIEDFTNASEHRGELRKSQPVTRTLDNDTQGKNTK